MKQRTAIMALVIMTVFSFVRGLSAEVTNNGGVVQEVVADGRYLPSSAARTPSGKVAVAESSVIYSNEFKAFDILPVKLSVGEKYIGINNSAPVKIPAHLNAVNLDLETTFPFFNVDSAYVRFGVTPSFYGDSWDFAPADFRIPFRLLGIYRPNEICTWIAGVGVYPEFERTVVPVVGVIYKPNDVWTVHLTSVRPHIDYRMTERCTLFVEGGGSIGEYEVEKEGYKSAVLQYKEFHTGGGIQYKVNEVITAAVSAGGVFSRALKYRDSLGKVSIKDGMYIALRLQARF